MANVEHSALTGSNLHEPKGVSSATSGTVYIADGLGSGSWSTVGLSSLSSTAKAFETQLFHIEDQKTSGTQGGTFTSGALRTRTLNTSVTNEITSASLASNQITLPDGTYWIEASAPAHEVSQHQAILYNTTDATTTLYGTTERCFNGSGVQTRSFIKGRFTIVGTKNFEIRHRCQTTVASTGLGSASNFGTEVYTQVLIWKIA